MTDEFEDASPRPWTVDEDGAMLDANGEQVGHIMPKRRAQNAALVMRAVGAHGPMREALRKVTLGDCPVCGLAHDNGHTAGCAIGVAIRAADGEGER